MTYTEHSFVPESLENLHGKVDLHWIMSLIPALLELQAEKPDGWSSPEFADKAHQMYPAGEFFRLKPLRTLNLLERIDYVRKHDNLWVANADLIRAECRDAAVRAAERRMQAEVAHDALLRVSALGPGTRSKARGSWMSIGTMLGKLFGG